MELTADPPGRGAAAPAPRHRVPLSSSPRRTRVAQRMVAIQQGLVDFFEGFETRARFTEDAWDRPEGGGGVSRVLSDGETFEKAGVNWSQVWGEVPPMMREHLDAEVEDERLVEFFATGVSVVAHPRSPRVPIVHLNVRFFELTDGMGEVVDGWFGGGCDLTPTYPEPEDAASFHRGLQRLCDRYAPELYPSFKGACDRYFVNTHREMEPRGVGGLFFDHLRGGDFGLGWPELFRMVQDVGGCLPEVYGPVVERRRRQAWSEEERVFQLQRRGRYVEFNLVHDRGTRFGLQTGARIESVLMSLPPMARWRYDVVPESGSFQEAFAAMLEPRDWASWEPAGR